MDVDKMLNLARQKMSEHPTLSGWTVKTNRSKHSAGLCAYGPRVISLSVPLLVNGSASDEEVLNTILHEIAHALVGPQYGHGPVWRSRHIELGGNGARLHSIKTQHRYTGSCGCGKKFHRDAKSARMTELMCRACRGTILWYDTVEKVTLTSTRRQSAYELAANKPAPQPMTQSAPATLCMKCFTVRALNGACNC